MVVVIDGFVSDRLQQDHSSIVTVESKMNLDRSLQPQSERGYEPLDLNEDNEEEDRAQSLDPSARPDHRRIKDNLHAL